MRFIRGVAGEVSQEWLVRFITGVAGEVCHEWLVKLVRSGW